MPDNSALPEASDRPHHLFVVRIWHELSHVLPDRWRGSVEHIPSGQRLYFASLGDLNDFITLRISSTSIEDGAERTHKGGSVKTMQATQASPRGE